MTADRVVVCEFAPEHYLAHVPATGQWVRLDLGPPYISVPMCTDCQVAIVRRYAEEAAPNYRYEIRSVTARAPRGNRTTQPR